MEVRGLRCQTAEQTDRPWSQTAATEANLQHAISIASSSEDHCRLIEWPGEWTWGEHLVQLVAETRAATVAIEQAVADASRDESERSWPAAQETIRLAHDQANEARRYAGRVLHEYRRAY